MKATRIALAVAALTVAGQASAFDVYVGGASALRDTMPRLMNQWCKPHADAARAVYEFDATAGAGIAADKDRRVYTCTFHDNTSNATVAADLGTLAGQAVRVFHSVEPGTSFDSKLGGSITGVVPLLYTGVANAQLNFVNPTGCASNGTDSTFASAPKLACETQAKHDTEIGLSDVEPGKFTAEYGNLADDATIPAEWKAPLPSDPATLTQAVAFIGGFGVAVTDNLVAAGVTNLSQAQLAALLSGQVSDWSQVGGPSLPVKVCRRTPGSGTQATFNALVSRKKCGANVGGAEFPDGRAADFSHISENATTGNVKTCLVNAQAAGIGGVGILGLENNADEASWDIIAYNGVQIWDKAGTGDTVDGTNDKVREDLIINGQYDLYVESTVQKRAGLGTDQDAFFTLLSTKAGDPLFTKNLPGIVSKADFRVTPALNEGAMYFSRSGDTCAPSTYQP